MVKRYVSIWFPYLKTDWFTRRNPALADLPFVTSIVFQGRMVVTAANKVAEAKGIFPGMVVADARAIVHDLQVNEEQPARFRRSLEQMAEFCIRFAPAVELDPPAGLLLDASGCSHLWKTDSGYLQAITERFRSLGYEARVAIADTIGCAWAVARYSPGTPVVESGMQKNAILSLPPAALRLESATADMLRNLGLRQVRDFISMPASALRRRFGPLLVERLHQALGTAVEMVNPLQPIEPFQERLSCLEFILTAGGIKIALERLLESLCNRLQASLKGLRQAHFKCYRVDGKMEMVTIGTNRPTHNQQHIFRLFEEKLSSIEPGFGIELFVLEAPVTEDVTPSQITIWEGEKAMAVQECTELLDRLAGRLGSQRIRRYLPAEHYWPERAVQIADSLEELPAVAWKTDRPRPIQLLPHPERIEVTAPIPDYPPMLFRYRGKLHTIKKADGPERIEQEWWLQDGEHRDYYSVEDDEGNRYWVFRSGHYTGDKSQQWFLHGFFA